MTKNTQETSRQQPRALFSEAFALHQRGQLEKAEALYTNLLKADPRHFDVLHLLGILANQTGRYPMAVELISQAIAINPNSEGPYFNLALALQTLRQFEAALFNYDKAIALKFGFVEAYYNRGVILKELKRFDEALASYDTAIAFKPDFAEAYIYRGLILKELKRLEEAVSSYDKAIALKPNIFESHCNRGLALKDMRRLNEALISFEKAIALKPDLVDAHYHRGDVLKDLMRLDEAVASYGKAFALKPDTEFLLGDLLYMKMTICDWQTLDTVLKNYVTDIHASKKITVPFPALSLLDAPELHKQAAKIYVDSRFPKIKQSEPVLASLRVKNEKIRIGYYSADFHNHATTYLMAELFEAHNADTFELFGFSFGPDRQDEMRRRVAAAFDHFFDVGDRSDADIARHSRELGIDIAVDLKGFTRDLRTGIFAERCAPIQVNYLGYPGTMGADYIDYIIADAAVIPKERQMDYTEKVVYLPHTYQVNDSHRQISQRLFTKEQAGLPESGFVFCCFNKSYKILPATFDAWMRILEAVEGSVLWLLEDNVWAADNLKREAELRGIDSRRLVFAQRMALDEHLARHRLADLFIDTLPYNAHTTASDALWTGLPVLTCTGKSFASRVSASLLNAIKIPELIAATPSEFETKAIELALNPEKLAAIKFKLQHNRLTTPLFDARLFAKHIESAYAAMYARYQAGLAPANIEVKA